jgi:hypothetical protein
MLSTTLKTGLLCTLAGIAAVPAHATTAQFLSRLYTEGLGRAPDIAAWKASPLFLSTPAACTSLDFASIAGNVYTSAEYNGLNYTSKEKVLTLYRGILSREPDDANGVQYWASILDSGTPIQTVINNFINTSEFTTLRDTRICAAIPAGQNSAYTWGQQPAIPLTVGTAAMTAAALQAQINAASTGTNKVVTLPQGTVVYANQQITIPAGVTVTTAGNLVRTQYAKMARIVRTANFTQPIIAMSGSTNSLPGAVLNSVWVSGQRNQVVNGTQITYLNSASTIVVYSGNNASVINNRLDSPVGGTNIGVDGSEPTGKLCNAVTVSNNLLTAYSNTHYGNSSVPYPFSDGITVKCADTTITNNTVMDASDVGIIQFYTDGLQTTQASKATGNLVISTGVSAYSALMYEPYFDASATKTRSFAGSKFENNTFFAAQGTRFEVGISAGRRAWGSPAPYYTSYASGGQFTNNTNAGISTAMQIGIAAGYATNMPITGNSLNYVGATGGCTSKGPIISENISAVTISGNTSNGAAVAAVPGTIGCSF